MDALAAWIGTNVADDQLLKPSVFSLQNAFHFISLLALW
jgi:hypothetical protein